MAEEATKDLQPLSEEEANAVRKQIEFYFGDSNFFKDKFLKNKAAQDPEGYVDLSVLCTFNKLKTLTPRGVENPVLIGKALAGSKVVSVSDDGLRVKKAESIPGDYNPDPLTVYAKGFNKTTTVEEIIEIFKPFGQCNYIKIRRTKPPQRAPKGSAFIEFANAAEAEAVAQKEIEFEGKKLILMMKSAYVEMKRKEFEERLKKKEGQKESKDGEVGEKRKREEPEEDETFTEGLIVKVSNLGGESTRKVLQEAVNGLLAESEKLEYVEYDDGDAIAFLRFGDPEVSKKFIEASNTKELIGCTVSSELVTGQEETDYWKKVRDMKKKRFKSGGKSNRGRGRGGRGRGRGGRRGRN